VLAAVAAPVLPKAEGKGGAHLLDLGAEKIGFWSV
jgi:hypothetical protein